MKNIEKYGRKVTTFLWGAVFMAMVMICASGMFDKTPDHIYVVSPSMSIIDSSKNEYTKLGYHVIEQTSQPVPMSANILIMEKNTKWNN
jgi:hypothetical protein